jgi:hypothetical protein
LLDIALGALGATGSILADCQRFLDRLLEINSTRVENDLRERVLESRRRLEARVRSLLQDVQLSAERAFGRAKAAQTAGAESVTRESARIARLEQAARALLSKEKSDATAAAGQSHE